MKLFMSMGGLPDPADVPGPLPAALSSTCPYRAPYLPACGPTPAPRAELQGPVSSCPCLIPSTWSSVGCTCVLNLCHVQLLATPWTVARQAPLSMGFSRQESWSGLPFPSPGDLPDPGIKPRSPAFQAAALTSEPPGKPQKVYTAQRSRTVTTCNEMIYIEKSKVSTEKLSELTNSMKLLDIKL